MKNNIYITVIIFTVIALALALGLVLPLFLSIKGDSENLILMKNTAVSLTTQNDIIENFKKKYEEYKPNLEKADHLFPDSKNPIDVIEFLEKTAKNSGINLRTTLSLSSGKKNQSVMNFQLSSNSTYSKIVDFSEKLENGPYLIEIENITMRNSDTDTSQKKHPSENIDATFSIQVYAK